MLSRRSVRIKVMQLLFSLSRDEQLTSKEAIQRYWSSIEGTYDLYLFNLYSLLAITNEALTDKKKRKAKHLPSEEDKLFTPILFKNEIISSLALNKPLQDKFKSANFESIANEDYYKKIYNNFSKNEVYQELLKNPSPSREEVLSTLLELYRLCRKDELYGEMMEDAFSSWQDDKSVVVGAVKKSLKQLPVAEDEAFFKDYYPDDETIKDFGITLMQQVIADDEQLLAIIDPALKNWDSERVAIIDMILLKMAVAEMIKFSSIPTKVTINEYLEVAKTYSTPKSKEFINGILDRLLKELEQSGKIVKEGRGLKT